MDPIDTLRAATTAAADLLDLPDRGRIALALVADLVAVPGDPLEDLSVLHRVEFMIRGGRIFVEPGSDAR